MGAIFISYRCDDSEGHAGRLAGDLTERFGRDAVFFDVDTIAPGEDFRRAIDDNVARCSVLLAQTNDEDTATRKAAMARLLAEHRNSGVPVGLAVDRLSEAQFPRLGKEGSVNALTLLVNGEPAAWSAAQRQEARTSLARIRAKVAAGQATFGPQVTELITRLEARLGGGKAAG